MFLRDHVSWLAPILVFGLLIFVHELGHFIAAKATGVYAPRFSIGFGPALWAHRWGETEYQLAAFPLGGYVRMASRDDEPAAILEGGSEESPEARAAHQDPHAMMPFGPLPIPPNRWFESKPLVGAALHHAGRRHDEPRARVRHRLPGSTCTTGARYRQTRRCSTMSCHRARVQRPDWLAGDSVVAVGGQAITSWKDLVAHVSPYPDAPILITVMSHGAARTVTVTPRATPDTNLATGAIRTVGKIGAAPRLDGRRHPMPRPQALSLAWHLTGNMAGLTFGSVHDLATRKASLSSLSGPVGIAKMSVEAARNGTPESALTADRIPERESGDPQSPADSDPRRRPDRHDGHRDRVKGRPFSLRTRRNTSCGSGSSRSRHALHARHVQ